MTLEQLQRRYHWLKYEADFIADDLAAAVDHILGSMIEN
mgnify:CR=1 FL=1